MRRSARHYPVAAAAVTAAVVAAAGALVWSRPLRRVEVVGDSMLPALRAGDRLLVLGPARIRPGDVVAVVDPRLPSRTMVKRVRTRTADGVVVLGDNAAASTDSRQLGPVPLSAVRGRAFYRYEPAGRRGRL